MQFFFIKRIEKHKSKQSEKKKNPDTLFMEMLSTELFFIQFKLASFFSFKKRENF
jgi:hypothetical protein